MKIHLFLVVALASPVLLAGCDEPPNKPPLPQTDQAKPAAGLFQDQRNALDKAKGVESTVNDQAQQQRETIEKSEK